MRKTMKYRLVEIGMCCCLLGVFTACSHSAEGIDKPGSTGEVTLSIGFYAPVATDADGYEAGETVENYIDVANGNYRIYFFGTDNKLIARFQPQGFTTAEGSDYTQYSVLGKAPDALAEHSSFKIVVLANWRHYPEDSDAGLQEGVTTIADICGVDDGADWAQFDCLTDGKTNPTSVALSSDAPDRLMPFYGVHTYENITFTAGQATLLTEPVTLLRAMAKVEVILETDDYYDLSFSSLYIDRYNAKGYCAPQNVFTHTDYDHNGNWTEDYVHTLHLVGNANDTADKTLACRKLNRWDEDGKRYEKWVAYLPEYQNVEAGTAYSSIKAKFNIQLENDTPHTIYFANYEGGTSSNDDNRLNIERNNIYRFHVKGTGYNFTLSLTVSNWAGLYENHFEYGDGQFLTPVSPWTDEVDNTVEF